MIWWLFWFYKSYQRLPTNQGGLSTNVPPLEEVPATNSYAPTLEAVYNSGITPSPPYPEDLPPPSYDEIFP